MSTFINPAMTTGLLKTANQLSELAANQGTQEAAQDNLGVNYALPVGSIVPYAGTVLPGGFLTCNGSAISRTTYAALFSIIGTTFGSGNGTTTFNLPNITAGLTASSGTIAYIIKFDFVSGLAPA
jgi:phage-related tail fiber protein